MRAEKKVLGELTLCYCVAPLEFRGKRHFLVASEKQHPCLLFDEQGVCVDQVWDGPGGTMTMVQLPGADGAFLATHRFYSPNDNKQASIVLCRWAEGTWQVRTLLDLPGVHRFDLLERSGVRYLIACTIKSDYAYKDDWRFPGKVWAAVLPDDLTDRPEDFRLEARVIAEGLTKNHGYSRHGCSGIVTAEEGVFRFTPPETPAGEWTCEKLLDQPTSDALLLDFDGDGAEELLTLSPFHGDTESVIPIILAVIVLKWLEKGLVKIIPEMLQIILVPGLSLIIMVPVILTVVGPVGAYIGYGMQWVYSQVMGFSPLVGGALVGALWGVFVIFGAHRALLPVGLNDVSVSAAAHKCGAGHNTLMCYAGAANFSQAGAALGVMLKTRSKKLRQVAGAATISAFLVGITEPAIYGCNLRKKRPMICAIIAGAVGGAIMGIGGASNHGFANNGILTIPTYQCADNTTGQFVAYLIGIAVAFFGAAVLTYVVGFEDDKDEELRVDA